MLLIYYIYLNSQSSSPDNWGGFSDASTKGRSESNGNGRRAAAAAVSTPDFDSIDVKSQRVKTTAPTVVGSSGSVNKTKKIEDDAWDLLNN